jgi:hypothetical protein
MPKILRRVGQKFRIAKLKDCEMTIWRSASVSEISSINLGDWRVIEVDGKENHLVGKNLDGWGGRVSTAVLNFDVNTRQATTKSGRIYSLIGTPGYDDDASYVLDHWLRINKVEAWNDITLEFLARLSKA